MRGGGTPNGRGGIMRVPNTAPSGGGGIPTEQSPVRIYSYTSLSRVEREREGNLPIMGGMGPPGGPMRGTGGGRIIPRGPDATGGGMATPL